MIAMIGMWETVMWLGIIALIMGGISFVAMLVHYDSQGETLKLGVSLPRLPIPWSVASKVRRRKMEAELAQAEMDLFDAKHARLQKELVFNELVDHSYHRALGVGSE